MAAGSGRGAREARARPLYPQLRPRPNGPCQREVAANQRARLCAAMVQAVGERAYEGASIAYVCALAGVSKRTLYQRFAGKEDCFLATYDRIVERGLARLRAGLDALLFEIAEHPQAARLALVDAPTIGGHVQERIERAETAFGRVLIDRLGHSCSIARSPLIARGIVNGVALVLQARLVGGTGGAEERREAGGEIAAIGPKLLGWILAYDAADVRKLEELSPLTTSLAYPPQTRVGGLTLTESRGPLDVSGGQRTRMLYAAARLAGAGGLESLTSGQIAEGARVDLEVFAQEFGGVEQCFLAAVDLVVANALARALREGGEARDWPSSVCRVLCGLIAQVASDRVLARVAFAECISAGMPGIERRGALVRGFANLLVRRAPRVCRPDPLTAEAIVGGVWGLVGHASLQANACELFSLIPYAAYLTLAPIIGAERAVETIHREFAGSSADLIAA